MSLLSTLGGTHTVEVILRHWVTNDRKKRVLEETGRVLATGRITPSTSSDAERYANSGVRIDEAVRFVVNEFPGDENSQVVYDNRTWDVRGAVQTHRASRMTSRDIIILTAKSGA